VVKLCTRQRHEQFLYFHLLLKNIHANPVAFPIVPKGKSSIRLVFHAHNTLLQVEDLVTAICSWACEMLKIEYGESEDALPSATRQVYAMQADMQM
jgi:8-amino-7-oxononanoate synthase